MSALTENNGDNGAGQPLTKKMKKEDDAVLKNQADNSTVGNNGGANVVEDADKSETPGDATASTAASETDKKDVSQDEDAPKEFDAETQKALEDIDACQNEIDSLNEKASEEILKVEQKYNKLRKPFFEKRNELIKNIPNFWVNAFTNHPTLTTILEEEEEECLHYLGKLEVEEFEDIKSGYKIIFYFNKNPYFKNTTLVKEFHLGTSGDPASSSTPIEWKDNEMAGRLKAQTIEKGPTRKGRKRKRCIARQTFFTWYLQNGDASTDDIAEVIKDDLWPNPLQYFLAADLELENGLYDETEDEDEEEEVEEGDADVVVVDSEQDPEDSELEQESEEYDDEDL